MPANLYSDKCNIKGGLGSDSTAEIIIDSGIAGEDVYSYMGSNVVDLYKMDAIIVTHVQKVSEL